MNLVNQKLNISLFSAFTDVRYEDDTHTYTVGGKKGVSVTQLKKQYKLPFDEDYWSKYTALKMTGYPLHPGQKGKTVMLMHTDEVDINDYRRYTDVKHEDILKEWRKKGKASRERGTYLHKYLEEGTWRKRTLEKNKVLEAFLDYYHSRFIPIVTEFVVANAERTVFGQLDNLSFDTTEEKFCIIDYKTDAEIKRENKYDKMLPPLEELDDCNFNEYLVQLNMYREFVLPYVEVSSLYVAHIQEDKVELIPIPLYNVEPLLNDYHKQRIISVSANN